MYLETHFYTQQGPQTSVATLHSTETPQLLSG